MNDSKHILQSTTLQSTIVMVIAFLCKSFNVDLDQGIITELVINVFALGGTIGIIYGRLKAKHDLGWKK